MRFSLLLVLLFSVFSSNIKAQYQWDGDNPVGDFTIANNWFGNTVPPLNNSNDDLLFEFRNQPQTSTYFNFASWAIVRSIIFQSTFGATVPLDGNGNGFDFWFKIENRSSFPQLINVPLSAKGTAMELNPTNADLTINNILYNDLNRNIFVYGPNNKILFLRNAIRGNASTQLQIKQYSIVSIGFANTPSSFSFGGGAHIEIGELWFEENSSLNGGVITIGNSNSNVAKLYLQDLNGGYTLPNNITVQASSPNCFVGGLNTSGTNIYSGNITLNAALQLENSSGGTSQFTGNITGSNGVTIDDVGGTGNATIQYSGVTKTYTGVTTINNGATLRISSNQSLGNIVLNTGGRLIVDPGVKLTVNGSWTGGGELVNNGTIELIGGNFFPGSTTNVTSMNILQVNKSGTVNLDNNLTITGSLILTAGNFDINPGRVLTLNTATMVNAAGFLVGSATSDLIVTGASGGTVLINNAIALRNILVDGTRTVSLNGTNDLTLYGNLNITVNATFNSGGNASQITNNGAAAINLSGTFITQHPGGFIGSGSAIPTVPLTINNNSTVDFGGLGDQQITATPNYFNIRFSGTGIKTPDNAISVHTNGLVSITGTCTVDATNNNIGSTGTNTTAFQMSSGIFKVGTAETLPLMRGTYTITGGSIQYVGASSKNIRSTAAFGYQNIEILGTNVNNGSGNISLNANGTFIIKNGGVFSMNSNSIIGPSGNETITIETGGRFNCSNIQGFYGPTVSGNSPSIRDNIENLILQPGSTVVYSRADPPLTGGNQVITNTHSYQNLELSGTGIKTAPSATLAILGNLIKSGSSTFAHNNGSVFLNGTTQSFAGLDYNILEMTGATKTLNGGASIRDSIKLNASTTLSIPATDSIVLKSDAVITARMGMIPASASINYNTTGKFVVHRYIRSGRKWRFLAVPIDDVNQNFKSSWQEAATPLQNPNPTFGFIIGNTTIANGFDIQTPGGPTVKTYDGATSSYVGIPSTTSPIQSIQPYPYAGYMSFVPGDRSVSAVGSTSSTTIRTRGRLYNPNLSPILLTLLGTGLYRGFGNPLASQINMQKILFPASPIESFYVYDPQAGGSLYGLGRFILLEYNSVSSKYEPLLDFGGAYSLPGINPDLIESGQGFFVQGDGVTTSLAITEAAKDITTAPSLSFTSGVMQTIKVILQTAPAPSSAPIKLDAFKVDYDSVFVNAVDSRDIRKIYNDDENISIFQSGDHLVIEKRDEIVMTDTIHMMMTKMKVQNYQLEIEATNLDFPGRTGFLLDRYLNTSTPLNMASTTTVNFNVSNVAGSYAADRFKIVFNQQAGGPLPVTFTTVTATRNADKSVAVQWKVEQEINIIGYEVERSNNGSNFTTAHSRTASGNNSSSVTYDHIDLAPFSGDNFYRIKATSVGGQVQYSNIVKLSGSKGTPLFSVYPNPVVDGKMQLNFTSQPVGRYGIQLLNAAGQVVYNSAIPVGTANQTTLVSLGVAKGSYRLLITNPGGVTTNLPVLLQ